MDNLIKKKKKVIDRFTLYTILMVMYVCACVCLDAIKRLARHVSTPPDNAINQLRIDDGHARSKRTIITHSSRAGKNTKNNRRPIDEISTDDGERAFSRHERSAHARKRFPLSRSCSLALQLCPRKKAVRKSRPVTTCRIRARV